MHTSEGQLIDLLFSTLALIGRACSAWWDQATPRTPDSSTKYVMAMNIFFPFSLDLESTCTPTLPYMAMEQPR